MAFSLLLFTPWTVDAMATAAAAALGREGRDVTYVCVCVGGGVLCAQASEQQSRYRVPQRCVNCHC